jgi:hypothetical protein
MAFRWNDISKLTVAQSRHLLGVRPPFRGGACPYGSVLRRFDAGPVPVPPAESAR